MTDLSGRNLHAVCQVRDALERLPRPVIGDVDIRFNRMSLDAMATLVDVLRKEPDACLRVGNNAFGFESFFRTVQTLGAMDLFDSQRLTLRATPQEIETEHLAARALRDDRIVQLADLVNNFVANADKERKEREKERQEREKERQEREKERKEREKERKERIRIEHVTKNRLDALDGHRRTGNQLIELFVGDVVEDVMRVEPGQYDRVHGLKLYDVYGSNVGEVDGLLMLDLRDGATADNMSFKLAVMIEAKSNMSMAEFDKVAVTKRTLQAAIGRCKEWSRSANPTNEPYRVKSSYNELHKIEDAEIVVAIGAPVVPREVAEAATEAGYLVVARDGERYVSVSEPPSWARFSCV